jgi:hypothetical protein
MATNTKEKPTQQQEPKPRTFLISSVQLTEVMRYLMSRPYAEVVKLMNMLSTLNQLDPKISADFVRNQVPGVSDGKK